MCLCGCVLLCHCLRVFVVVRMNVFLSGSVSVFFLCVCVFASLSLSLSTPRPLVSEPQHCPAWWAVPLQQHHVHGHLHWTSEQSAAKEARPQGVVQFHCVCVLSRCTTPSTPPQHAKALQTLFTHPPPMPSTLFTHLPPSPHCTSRANLYAVRRPGRLLCRLQPWMRRRSVITSTATTQRTRAETRPLFSPLRWAGAG